MARVPALSSEHAFRRLAQRDLSAERSISAAHSLVPLLPSLTPARLEVVALLLRLLFQNQVGGDGER